MMTFSLKFLLAVSISVSLIAGLAFTAKKHQRVLQELRGKIRLLEQENQQLKEESILLQRQMLDRYGPIYFNGAPGRP